MNVSRETLTKAGIGSETANCVQVSFKKVVLEDEKSFFTFLRGRR